MYGHTWADLLTTTPQATWQMLRRLRHQPPGRANKGDRKETFNAALEQAEQLFTAAAAVGPAARPLLVFYGISQAGRAIAAAASDVSNQDYRLGGHGIKPNEMQGAATHGTASVTLEDQGNSGAFISLASILQAASLPVPVRLGDLWCLLPESRRFPLPGMGPSHPVSVRSRPRHLDNPENMQFSAGRLPPQLAYRPTNHDLGATDPGWVEERDRVAKFLELYPSLGDWTFREPVGKPVALAAGIDETEVYLQWPASYYADSEEVVVARHTVGYPGGARLAFPTVGASSLTAHPFLLWWAVLFGLSMLARYEPKAWDYLISVNDSADAAAIEHLLDQSLSTVPELIHRTVLEVTGSDS